ncbi:MAG: transcription antitermination factor NusB [Ruaniaceae bacterium]|nr:transcription antitermination factor NusB [Ruaniaceae bacterium]
MTARTKARRRAVDILFEADQRGMYSPLGLSDLLQERLALTAAQTALPEYSADIVDGVSTHLEPIDSVLSEYVQGRPLDRLPAVDRAILRMAIWEMFFNHEINRTIAISEATTLAAELSTDSSPALVNAVLDRVRNAETAVSADLGVH